MSPSETAPPAGKMHAGEVDTDPSLVRRLLAAQFPHWAGLPIEPVASAGTDNAIYRVGDELAVRLPRISWATGQVAREQRWLPLLAPLLPVAIPVPLAQGEPGEGYPWNWSVYRWLKGENPRRRNCRGGRAGVGAGGVHAAVVSDDLLDGRPAGAQRALSERDDPTRAAIDALHGMIDTSAAAAAWGRALQASAWSETPRWVHGDLAPGNLLLVEGRLNAVIDFAGVGVGDPACDLMVAWNLLPASSRSDFRAALQIDDATWDRGRGWALSVALIQLPYYHQTNPLLAASARYTIAQVLADHGLTVRLPVVPVGFDHARQALDGTAELRDRQRRDMVLHRGDPVGLRALVHVGGLEAHRVQKVPLLAVAVVGEVELHAVGASRRHCHRPRTTSSGSTVHDGPEAGRGASTCGRPSQTPAGGESSFSSRATRPSAACPTATTRRWPRLPSPAVRRCSVGCQAPCGCDVTAGPPPPRPAGRARRERAAARAVARSRGAAPRRQREPAVARTGDERLATRREPGAVALEHERRQPRARRAAGAARAPRAARSPRAAAGRTCTEAPRPRRSRWRPRRDGRRASRQQPKFST